MLLILSGPVHSGKTTLLKKIITELKKGEYYIDGFLSHPVKKKKETIGYDLLDIKEEILTPFITKSGEKNWQNIGPFFFNPQGLEKAKQIIDRSIGADLLIIDELGPLELKNRGLWPLLKPVLQNQKISILLVIRDNILADFLNRMDKKKTVLFYNRQNDVFGEMIRTIKRIVVK
jgi:nucleoside-triphosphatase